jgi:hypothetical protein
VAGNNTLRINRGSGSPGRRVRRAGDPATGWNRGGVSPTERRGSHQIGLMPGIGAIGDDNPGRDRHTAGRLQLRMLAAIAHERPGPSPRREAVWHRCSSSPSDRADHGGHGGAFGAAGIRRPDPPAAPEPSERKAKIWSTVLACLMIASASRAIVHGIETGPGTRRLLWLLI